MQTTTWQKKWRKNWKTWLLSALMAMTLVGGGTATLGRLLRPAAPSARMAATATALSQRNLTPTANQPPPQPTIAATPKPQALTIQPQFDQATNFAETQPSSTPIISLEPDFGPANTSLQVEGQGWTPSSTVLIYLTPPGIHGISGDPVARVQADTAGQFTATVTIPAESQWQEGALATVYAQTGQATAELPTMTSPPSQPTVIPAKSTATPIAETPPSAVINSPTTAQFGQAITFDASASQSNSDGQIAAYVWDFGDGTTARGAQVSHSYKSPGSYQVTLNVTDTHGLSSTAIQTVQMAGNWPVAIISSSATQAEPGQEINFSGSNSHASPGRHIVSYHWDLGDGHHQC